MNIRAYTPPSIRIANDDDPSTNWSKAKVFSERGEYVLEIHFDAYRPHGFGSGLIPVLPNVRELNVVDESLAQAFGRYPRLFRGGLGGPRRGIGILEIAMLEPPLETKLRDPRSREHGELPGRARGERARSRRQLVDRSMGATALIQRGITEPVLRLSEQFGQQGLP